MVSVSGIGRIIREQVYVGGRNVVSAGVIYNICIIYWRERICFVKGHL